MGSVIPRESPSDITLTALLAPVIDPQTYKHFLYFVLAFPLGFMYSFGLGLGLLVGVGLSILGIGIGILLALVVVSRGLAAFERWLANRLLNVSLTAPPAGNSGDGLRETIRAYLATETTWRGLAFLMLKLWVGIIGVVMLFAVATVVSMLSAIVRLPHTVEFGEVNGEPVVWTVQTVPEAALAALLGGIAGLFILHLVNAFGYAARRFAEALL
jgi:hypothetical protein